MRQLLLYAAVLLLLPFGSSAQRGLHTSSTHFGALRARQIGPATMSGRISSLAVAPGGSDVIYIGSAGGGLWKSQSGGTTVRPVFDDYTQSIGKVAVAPTDASIVWVGTGEPWTRNSVSVGTGLYKSTNAGTDWQAVGLEQSERIADIIIHPTNPDIVYVAALGHLWNASAERGVYKTTDGGKTWAKILYVDENTGAADLSIDPRDPDILYASMWSFRRQPWTFDSGFTGGSGLYKTTDGGKSWATIHRGLPQEKLGRIAVAVAPSRGDVVYASVEAKSKAGKGLYRSDDAGASWTKINEEFNATVRPFYFSNLTVDPTNDSIVAKCGLQAIISEDGGRTFRAMDYSVHSDIHDIWIDPDNPKHILLATDGGVYESFDRGYTFRMWRNLPVSQFYHVSVDMDTPFNVYGGLQDNGSWYGPSQKAGGIGNADWQLTYGGDGFYSFRHPVRRNYVFSEYQGGNLVRYDLQTGQAKNIFPYARVGEEKLRWNWNAPLHLSPTNPERMYFGAQYLFRSDDSGDSWQRISPDLTTDDATKQRQFESGGLSIDNSTAENHTTIYTIAESPRDGNTIWVGTDDGNLQFTTDGGEQWTNVVSRLPGLPPHTWVSFIEASPHDARTAFVTFDGHRTGDMQPYLYRTTDGGTTWTSLITEDIEGYALSVRQDPVNADLLFLGTEFGLYISLDGGQSWARFSNNVPRVGVRDLVIHPRDHALVLATHGRGIILLDDIRPLRQLDADLLASERVTFLETPPVVLRDPGAGSSWYSGSGDFVADNPSGSARIVYYSPKRHTFGKMYVEVYQGDRLLQTLPAGKAAGLNEVTIPTSLPFPQSAPTNNRMALGSSLYRPTLPAGTYPVKLIKGRDTLLTQFTLTYDTASPYTAAERQVQRETVMELYAMSEQLAYVYHVLEQVRTQADTLTGLRKKEQAGARAVADWAAREQERLTFQGGDFYVDEEEKIREEISKLYSAIGSYPGRPSEQQVAEAARLRAELDRAQRRFDDFLTGDVAALNVALQRAQRPALQWDELATFLGREAESGDTGSSGSRQLLPGLARRLAW